MAHIAMQDVAMVNVQPVNIGVVVGNGTEVTCIKCGDIMLLMGQKILMLKDVLYTPNFHKNIISIGVLIHDSYNLTISGSIMTIKKAQNELCF
jgi:hypothetical protein